MQQPAPVPEESSPPCSFPEDSTADRSSPPRKRSAFFSKNGGSPPPSTTRRKGLFCGMFRRPGGRLFRRLFGDATLRDTVKPLLIPCFDLSTAAPFLFSRADALESDGYNFLIREVCAATCAGKSVVEIKSVDGRTSISAVGGAVAMANPTSAAITHVLHNKQEFPFAAGVRDLHVFTVAGADAGCSGRSSPSTAALLQIAGNGMADTVDQAIAMAFSQNGIQTGNYVRIQAHSFSNKISTRDEKEMMTMVEEMLSQKNIESVLFQGKRLSQETSIEKMEQFCNELIKEHEKRKTSLIPTVIVKKA
ncbi:hypothetical protein HPP92_015176 [Vanilla planifolia]|uniref:PNPLA domain-containing protein n=1 Tax=Vanilla planifolia TaxID=51239 RepID=A0A835QLD9_VANPL|nr:hypothetical protein HPP92_015176 [Vanilla planifolia]